MLPVHEVCSSRRKWVDNELVGERAEEKVMHAARGRSDPDCALPEIL